MDPINYMAAMPQIDLGQSIRSGLMTAKAFAELAQMGAAAEQQRQAQAAQQAYAQDIGAFLSAPSVQGARGLLAKYPQQHQAYGELIKGLTEDQQKAEVKDAADLASMISTGNVEMARAKIAERRVAMQNSGQPTNALDMLDQQLQTNPAQAHGTALLTLAALPGGQTVLDNLQKAGQMPSKLQQSASEADKAAGEARKVAAEANTAEITAANAPTAQALDMQAKRIGIQNVQSEISDRARRFGLEKDKFETDTNIRLRELQQKLSQLPEYVAKDVGSASMDAIASQNSAAKMNDLAAQIDRAASDLGGGVTAKAGEIWKKTFGGQNDLTRIRAEYNQIVTPAAMAAYKKVASGSTSDKDIETAMTGVPKDTDSPERMASFLRGAAKLQTYDAVLQNAKSEWLASVQNLGKSRSDVEIDGVRVPAGTTFKQFQDQYVTAKAAKLSDAATLQSRSYMRFANPGAK